TNLCPYTTLFRSRGNEQRSRREEEGERFRMEHRRCLEHSRAGNREDKCCDMENRASGPELPDEQKKENERPETCERVRDLPDTLGMRKTEPFSNEDSEGSDREETRRCVVAAGGVREAAVVSKPVRVVQR